MAKASDEQLVLRYLKGDEEAFEMLVKKYLPLIYSFSRQYAGSSVKASDITQETFVKAWRNIKKFDKTKSFKPWLFTIAKNTALDWLRKREDVPFSFLERGLDGNIIETIADSQPSPEKIFENAENIRLLSDSLKLLPENYRTVVLLRNENDLTFREIAKMLKKPLNTVKSHYRRALVILRR